MGMAPSVAPVLIPHFGRYTARTAPQLKIHIHEHPSLRLIDALQRSELDLAVMNNSDLADANLLSIELWTERFVLYASPSHALYARENIRPEEMLDGNIWTLRSFHDHYPQLAEVTHQPTFRQTFL